MEVIRQDNGVEKNKEVISIFDLGMQASDMLQKWKELKEKNSKVSLKELPNIDFYQMVDGKPLMETILELAILIEINKKQLVRKRQAEGIAKAREKGIKLGRREKNIPENFKDIYVQVIAKKMTLKKATEILDVDYKTYKKWGKQFEKK